MDNWIVIRIDDNGFSEIMSVDLTESQATELVQVMEARGHKQTYIARRIDSPNDRD